MKNSQKQGQKKTSTWRLAGIFALGSATIFVVFLTLLFHTQSLKLSARTDAGSFTTPEIFSNTVDDCNLGLISACNDNGQYVSGPESILKTWFFSTAVPWWISFFIALAAGVAILMLMVGGIIIMIAAENTELRGKGRKTITWALLGLLIALFAFTAVAILENLPLPGSTAIAPPLQK